MIYWSWSASNKKHPRVCRRTRGSVSVRGALILTKCNSVKGNATFCVHVWRATQKVTSAGMWNSQLELSSNQINAMSSVWAVLSALSAHCSKETNTAIIIHLSFTVSPHLYHPSALFSLFMARMNGHTKTLLDELTSIYKRLCFLCFVFHTAA